MNSLTNVSHCKISEIVDSETQTSSDIECKPRDNKKNYNRPPLPRDVKQQSEDRNRTVYEFCHIEKGAPGSKIPITIIRDKFVEETHCHPEISSEDATSRRYTYCREVIEPYLKLTPGVCHEVDDDFIRDALKIAAEDFPDNNKSCCDLTNKENTIIVDTESTFSKFTNVVMDSYYSKDCETRDNTKSSDSSLINLNEEKQDLLTVCESTELKTETVTPGVPTTIENSKMPFKSPFCNEPESSKGPCPVPYYSCEENSTKDLEPEPNTSESEILEKSEIFEKSETKLPSKSCIPKSDPNIKVPVIAMKSESADKAPKFIIKDRSGLCDDAEQSTSKVEKPHTPFEPFVSAVLGFFSRLSGSSPGQRSTSLTAQSFLDSESKTSIESFPEMAKSTFNGDVDQRSSSITAQSFPDNESKTSIESFADKAKSTLKSSINECVKSLSNVVCKVKDDLSKDPSRSENSEATESKQNVPETPKDVTKSGVTKCSSTYNNMLSRFKNESSDEWTGFEKLKTNIDEASEKIKDYTEKTSKKLVKAAEVVAQNVKSYSGSVRKGMRACSETIVDNTKQCSDTMKEMCSNVNIKGKINSFENYLVGDRFNESSEYDVPMKPTNVSLTSLVTNTTDLPQAGIFSTIGMTLRSIFSKEKQMAAMADDEGDDENEMPAELHTNIDDIPF